MKEFIKAILFFSAVLTLVVFLSLFSRWVDGKIIVKNAEYQAGYLAGNHACQVANEQIEELREEGKLEINQ